MNANSAIIVTTNLRKPLVLQSETCVVDDRSRRVLSRPRVFADKRTKTRESGKSYRTEQWPAPTIDLNQGSTAWPFANKLASSTCTGVHGRAEKRRGQDSNLR